MNCLIEVYFPPQNGAPGAGVIANGRMPGATANGRYRTYEAFSGCDLDPVHVSDYHQIPYATFYPSLTMNVIYTGWAEMQLADGMIQEASTLASNPSRCPCFVSIYDTSIPLRSRYLAPWAVGVALQAQWTRVLAEESCRKYASNSLDQSSVGMLFERLLVIAATRLASSF